MRMVTTTNYAFAMPAWLRMTILQATLISAHQRTDHVGGNKACECA